MCTSLEEKVTQCLVAVNLTMTQLAAEMGLSEATLTTLCRHGDLRLFEMEQLGQCLRVPATYVLGPITQTGTFNQGRRRQHRQD
jgi:DNA-binding Xre family transcriptional regulator